MSDRPTELLPEHPDHPDHHRHQAPPPKGTSTRNLVIGLAVALFLILIAIIIWLLFFRGGPGPAPTNTPTGSATPTETPTQTPTQTVSPPPLDPSTCTTDNSTVEFGQSDGAAGSTFVPLIFTNTGSEACTLEGFPTVEFVGDGDGTQVGLAATEDTTTAPVELITIEPGDVAISTLKITSAGNVCDPVSVDGFRVIPPGSTDAFFIEETTYPACDGDLSIMTVSAINQN